MQHRKAWKLLLGTVSMSYFVHLESVIIPSYFGWWRVVVSLGCILWSNIAMVSLIVLMFIIWRDL